MLGRTSAAAPFRVEPMEQTIQVAGAGERHELQFTITNDSSEPIRVAGIEFY